MKTFQAQERMITRVFDELRQLITAILRRVCKSEMAATWTSIPMIELFAPENLLGAKTILTAEGLTVQQQVGSLKEFDQLQLA